MKKNLLLVLVLFSTFGFSQQVLKKITDTPNYTIVDLYVFRNGTTNGNVVGNSNYDINSSEATGDIIFANSIGSLTFSYNSGTNDGTPIIPNETICNGNFEVINSGDGTLTNFICDQNFTDVLNINVPTRNSNRDEINDGNSLIDLFHTQFSIPKLLNDNSAIPNGTWAICSSRDAVDLVSGSTMPSSKNVILRFNGTTWVLQTTYPNGNPVPALQDVCSSLSISEIDNSKSKIFIYPNPTNNFIIIQNRQNSTENFEFKIVDLTGKIVNKGSSKFNDPINIQSLTNGNYIIQIETENGEKFTEKLIKN